MIVLAKSLCGWNGKQAQQYGKAIITCLCLEACNYGEPNELIERNKCTDCVLLQQASFALLERLRDHTNDLIPLIGSVERSLTFSKASLINH